MPTRQPHVAGTFYPSKASELEEFCLTHLIPSPPLVPARAVILPHAGYVYSGATACRVLSRVVVPPKIFLVGPNHRGLGADFSLYPKGQWETPLGRISVEEGLSRALLAEVPALVEDEAAHALEHSLEVLVPLLQHRDPHLQIVPMLVGTLDLKQAREAALGCGEVLAHQSAPVLLVISNDMNHYEDEETTHQKDRYALEAIENLDAAALVKAVKQYRISMCGFVPVYMLLVMGERLGFQRATLVDYRTSAETTGDRDRVVGYAGFVLE